MAEYIKREDVLKILRLTKFDCAYNRDKLMYDGKLNVYQALLDRINVFPAADVVEGHMYRTVLEKMNEYADKLLQIREISGGRNG